VEVSTGFVDEQYREMAMSDCDDGDDDDADDMVAGGKYVPKT
jgi:hypothetical protein